MELKPRIHFPSQGMMENQQANYLPQQYNRQTPYDYFAKPAQPIDFINYLTFSPQQASYYEEQQVNEQGQVDFDKMLTTVGQLASTYHQISPIVKQLGSLVQLLKI